MTDIDPWVRLGPVLGPELCGYTHEDHVHNVGGEDQVLKCVRAPGHAGATLAIETHVASLDGQPVFFGEPLQADPETGELIPWQA